MCNASTKLHRLVFQLAEVANIDGGCKLAAQPAVLVWLQQDGALVLVQNRLPSTTGHAGKSTQTTETLLGLKH